MAKTAAAAKSANTELKMTDYLFYYMWHVVTESQRKIEEAMRPYGVKSPAWRVIMILREKKRLTISEIATEVLLENSRLSRIAKSLEEAGIVQRAKCDTDQRYTQIELTDKGNKLYEELIPIVERQLESTLAGLSAQDRKKLDQMMRTMKDNTYRPAFANLG